MAQVPYSPIPNVSPNYEPVRPVGVNSPEAAFGAPQAEALSKFGKVLDTASDEIAARAQAMQQLKNESDARMAGVGFANDASTLYSNFKEQYGANAGPEALAKYQSDLNGLQQKYAKGLSNPTAQNMYNNDSFNYLTRLNLYGAAHSAEQLKQYSMASNKAAVEATNNAIQLNPTDEAGFKAGLDANEKHVRDMAAAQGLSPQDTNQQVAIARSNAWEGRIRAVGVTNPQLATAMFSAAQKDNQIRGERLGVIQQFLDGQNQKISSRNIANGLWDGTSMALGKGPVSIDRAKDAIAMGIESGGDYNAVGPAVMRGGKEYHAYGKYQVMDYNLSDWLHQSGLPNMSPDQFKADHAAQEKVFETIFGGYMQKYGSFNAAAQMWFTGKTGEDAIKTGGDGHTTVPGYLAATNARLKKTASLTDMQAAARSQADALSPDDPAVGDAAVARVEVRQAQDDRAAKEADQQKWGIINDALDAASQKHESFSEESLKNDPKVKAAIDGLDGADHLKFQKMLLGVMKNDNEDTDKRTANFNQLKGAAYLNPDEFNGVNLYSGEVDLTANQRSELRSMQRTTQMKGQIDDPQLKRMLADPELSDALQDAGLLDAEGKPVDKTKFAQFAGAVATELNAQRVTGKEVTPEQGQDIVKNMLLYPKSQQGRVWNGTRTWETQVPDDVKPKISSSLQQQLGRPPTDQEIQRKYTIMLYNQVLKEKSNAGQ